MRINKYIAMGGMFSRREADKLIENRRVYVNGKLALSGMDVTDSDEVLVDGNPCKPVEKKVVLAFYKPIGVTCSEKDEHAEELVSDYIDYPVRLTYAGRLDKDSEGLLLMTNDGALIDGMMRGSNGHEKEYHVKVNKPLQKEHIEALQKGVYLTELKVKTRPCKIKVYSEREFGITLTQGLNRQIRRMCGAFGYRVDSLKRVRVMNIKLEGLKPGQWRELSEAEEAELRKLVSKKEKRN